MKYIILGIDGFCDERALEIKEVHYTIDPSIIQNDCPDLEQYRVRSINGKCPISKRATNAKTDNKNPNIQVVYGDVLDARYPVLLETKKNLIDFLNGDFFDDKDTVMSSRRSLGIYNRTAIDEFKDDDVFDIGSIIRDVYYGSKDRKGFPQKYIDYMTTGGGATPKYRCYNNIPYTYVKKEYDENIPIVRFSDFDKKVILESSGTNIDNMEMVNQLAKFLDDVNNFKVAEGIIKNSDLESEKNFPYIAYLNYLTGYVSSSQYPACKVLKKKHPSLVHAVKSKIGQYAYGRADELYPCHVLVNLLESTCKGGDNIPADIMQAIDDEYNRVFNLIINCATMGYYHKGEESWLTKRFKRIHNFK